MWFYLKSSSIVVIKSRVFLHPNIIPSSWREICIIAQVFCWWNSGMSLPAMHDVYFLSLFSPSLHANNENIFEEKSTKSRSHMSLIFQCFFSILVHQLCMKIYFLFVVADFSERNFSSILETLRNISAWVCSGHCWNSFKLRVEYSTGFFLLFRKRKNKFLFTLQIFISFSG